MTGNGWEARRRDDEIARPRDDETTGLQDHGTARPRDCGTARLLKNTGVLSHSQAFSVMRGCARLCEAAWRQSGAAVPPIKRLGWMDSTLTYIPFSPMIEAALMRRYHDKGLVSEGRRVQHSAKMPSMGSTKAYVPLTAFFVRGRNRPLITPS